MNPIQHLDSVLALLFPDADRKIHKPLHQDGFWTLDVQYPNYLLVIDWRAESGFLLTADEEHGYGEPADEHYAELPQALARTIKLVQHRLETVPPYPVRIRELREKLGMTQTDVAREMGVQQAAVSKLESREDTHVATLISYVKALGGKLVMRAEFPGRAEVIDLVVAE